MMRRMPATSTTASAPLDIAPEHPAPRLSDRRMRAFADRRTLSREELLNAPLRWPRPERLREPLQLPAGKLADGMSTLGLATIGDLLEHLPRDSRESCTVADLRAGEQATVAVQVRAISSRAVRRRGMRPLVEASVRDETGTMRATFFNQPWLVQRYPAGTNVVLHGKADGRGGFRVSHHAPAAQLGLGSYDAPAEVAACSRLAHTSPTCSSRCLARCASASGYPIAQVRWQRCTSRATQPTRRAGASAWPSTSCC
jgi:hypothetical protein